MNEAFGPEIDATRKWPETALAGRKRGQIPGQGLNMPTKPEYMGNTQEYCRLSLPV